ncbi:hypothetical protein A4G28_27365 [Mycobacterium ostraviense]|uniref:Uncharacterized protein n=1 Tax=Mycobacterium ostraviense TaxID=2738409 RepID=A0A164CDV9_9MYCO|nr:hypothetical protein [Mycobacterium ostraviense]KZS64579.1 hypothetical protein A4G28_27365 [Mycobacterium ostraviense]
MATYAAGPARAQKPEGGTAGPAVPAQTAGKPVLAGPAERSATRGARTPNVARATGPTVTANL